MSELNPIQVVDQSSIIQVVGNKQKDKALKLLSKFDIEWSEDRTKVKHYALDDYSVTSNPEDLAERVERMSVAMWHTVAGYIEQALPITAPILETGFIKPIEVGTRPTKTKKLGKIYTCRPARFGSVNVPVEVVQPYLYTYKDQTGGTEMQGEINFGIEIY